MTLITKTLVSCVIISLVISYGSGFVAKRVIGAPPTENTDQTKDKSDEGNKDSAEKEYMVGDMALDKDEVQTLYEKRPRKNNRRKRAAFLSDHSKRWPKVNCEVVIPYIFVADKFNDVQQKDLMTFFAFLKSETCIRFRPRNQSDVNWVKIDDCGDGCWGDVGLQGGEQKVCLGSGCKWPGLYAHTFGHIIGLIDEQSRPDRDDYIDIHYDNIKPNSISVFKKVVNGSVWMTSYDFPSVMHIERTAFAATKGTFTITAKQDWNNVKLGKVWWKMFSYLDILQLNNAYGCGAHCPENINCLDGFVDKKCTCVKKDDYYKRRCVNDFGDDNKCDLWANVFKPSECTKSEGWMNFQCRKACGTCYN